MKEATFFLVFLKLVRVGVDEIHKFLTSLGLLESSREIACHGYRTHLLHTAHLHTHVLGLYHHHHAKRMESLLDALAYLLGESLLHLKTMGEDVNNTCYLAKTSDITIGDISHMCLAIERKHVVLAKREHVDVLSMTIWL